MSIKPVLALLLFALSSCNAQYQISLWSLNITNPEYNNHTIPLQIWYPSTKSTEGGYPVIVFTHGWECNNSWYDFIVQNLVPQGYIVALPDDYMVGTQQTSAQEFARSQRFTLDWLYKTANTQKGSPLYQQVGNKSMASGHSEGGGATIYSIANANVGQKFDYEFDSAMPLSPCGGPARSITKPILLMTGSHDCMCQPATEAIKDYNEIPATTCKFLADITNATHCNFMVSPVSNNEMCKVLDAGCVDHSSDISQKVQVEFVNKYMTMFAKAALMGDTNQYKQIATDIQQDQSGGKMVNSTSSCS